MMQYMYMRSKEHGLILVIKILSEVHARTGVLTNKQLIACRRDPLESYSVMRFLYITELESLLLRSQNKTATGHLPEVNKSCLYSLKLFS
jgi:hypothetical protein